MPSELGDPFNIQAAKATKKEAQFYYVGYYEFIPICV